MKSSNAVARGRVAVVALAGLALGICWWTCANSGSVDPALHGVRGEIRGLMASVEELRKAQALQERVMLAAASQGASIVERQPVADPSSLESLRSSLGDLSVEVQALAASVAKLEAAQKSIRELKGLPPDGPALLRFWADIRADYKVAVDAVLHMRAVDIIKLYGSPTNIRADDGRLRLGYVLGSGEGAPWVAFRLVDNCLLDVLWGGG